MKKFVRFVGAIGLGATTTCIAAMPTLADVKIGALAALTGPVAGMVKEINNAERAAIEEINAAGGVLGQKAVLIEADTGCNSQIGVDAASKLINIEQVVAIVGGTCSGETIPAASNVAAPANVLMVSPASTSPEITNLKDNGVLFRVVPSDNYQGRYMAKLLMSKGINKVALTYINTDYGVGLARAFRDTFKSMGGEIAGDEVHEGKKQSYRSELASLARGGASTLVLFAMAEDSGMVILKQALEGGMFKHFAGGEGLKIDSLLKSIGAINLEGKLFGTVPTAVEGPAKKKLREMYGDNQKFKFTSSYTAQAYDATMLVALAIQKAGSTDRKAVVAALREVSNAPGEPVGPGEWAKAVELIKAGKKINYQGASGAIEFDAAGDVEGVIAEWIVEGDRFVENKPRPLD